MADAAALLYSDQPATTNAVIHDPAAAGTVVRLIHAYNTDTVSKYISIGITGTAATQANCFWYQLVVPAKSAVDWSGFMFLADADTLNALQETATSITLTVSGVTL